MDHLVDLVLEKQPGFEQNPAWGPLFVQKQHPQEILPVINQFEETFTMNQDEIERQAFIDNLMESVKNASTPPICLVIALRVDFYTACAPYEELCLALTGRQEYIGAMTGEELRQVIEKPAAAGD